MARPSRTGGKISEAKTRKASPGKGRKTTKNKRRLGPAGTRAKRRSLSGPRQDLKEAREQQAATAEILTVIASSPSDVQTVFETIASSANRLIGGFSTAVHRVIDDINHLVAFTPTNPESDEALKAAFPRHRSEVPPVALVENGETAQIADAETADAQTRQLGRARGWRSVTFTPLMSQGTLIGYIACTRRETGVLADHHVQLLRTFADQAVIAIENARLLKELRQRTSDLSEALTYQTGSANILRVIASLPTDVAPVLDAIVESASELCGADDAIVFLKDGGDLRSAAHSGPIAAGPASVPIMRGWITGRSFLDRKPVHVRDLLSAEGAEFPDGQKIARSVGFRTILTVPLLREGESIGVIMLRRKEVHPFRDKQITLLQSFADQAVIAIENARLFNETREALERLTATADILRVIASSPSDVQPVFEAIAESAARLCKAEFCNVFRFDGELIHFMHSYGYSREAIEDLRHFYPMRPGRGSCAGRAILNGKVEQVPDVRADPEYAQGNVPDIMQISSVIAVPMLKEHRAVGAIALVRAAKGTLPQRQIDLLKTFADQAVIAIENVRLFEEVQAKTRDLTEALTYQTGSASILKVIASSPTDINPVL